MRVVDLADEFGLTTAETIDACLWAGVAADGAATELTAEEVALVRTHMSTWSEAGFAPWHGGTSNANVAVAGAASPASRGGGPSTTATRPDDGEPDDLDGPEDFSSRANRLKRREPGGDGLAAVAGDQATRRAPDRVPQPTGPSSTLPNRGGATPAASGSLPKRAAELGGTVPAAARARADGQPAPPAPAPAPAPTTAQPTSKDARPAPPARPSPATEATIAVGAAAGAGGATATATVAPPRTADASEAPDDDFGPSGPGTEVVGPSTVEALAPVLPAMQGGPTGWLPGGPKARPHLAPLAIIALALAIASLAIPFVPAIIAIVLASITKDRIDRSRGWLRGKPVATVAQVVAGIGVGLWLVLIVGSILLADRDTTAQAPDLQVDTGLVAYTDIQVGDCVRLPRIGEVNQWHQVQCADPHQAEMFAVLVAGNPKSQTYPGDLPIEKTAKDGCRQKLAEYAGTGGDADRLEVGYAYPSAVTWKNETDRTIFCVAFRSDGALLQNSLKIPSTIPDAAAGN